MQGPRRQGTIVKARSGWLPPRNGLRFGLRQRELGTSPERHGRGLVVAGLATYINGLRHWLESIGNGRQNRRNNPDFSRLGSGRFSEVAQRAWASDGTRGNPPRALPGAAGGEPAQWQGRHPGEGRNPTAARARRR